MKSEKSLLSLTKKDFTVTYFSGSGSGGQHRNKHQNCVRIKHEESGITVIGTEQKSRTQNQKIAFRRLCTNKKFMNWLKIKSIHESDIKRKVEEAMKEENLKVEKKEDGKWVSY